MSDGRVCRGGRGTRAFIDVSSAKITAYCTRADLQGWLVSLMTAHRLLALPIAYGESSPPVVSDPSSLTLTPNINRVFLFPATAKTKRPIQGIGDVKARRWGWVDCEVGDVKERDGVRVLTKSSITAEDSDVEKVHPARFVRALKRRLAKCTKRGVRAVGTDVVYKSLLYTDAAVQLARAGVPWKHSLTSRSSFEPNDP